MEYRSKHDDINHKADESLKRPRIMDPANVTIDTRPNRKHNTQQLSQFNMFGVNLFVSEFLGTFAYVYLAQAAVTSFELTGTINDAIGRQVAAVCSCGLALMLATALTLVQTGAHLNPAISLARCVFGTLKCSRTIKYMFAQYGGALVAAGALNLTFCDKLSQRHSEGLLVGANVTLRAHGSLLSTGKLFTSYPPNEVSLSQLFVSYTIASALFSLMIFFVMGTRDCRHMYIPLNLKPIYAAASLVLIQSAFAANGGPVVNPAQDFSPRLYISLAGWGLAAFNLYHYQYWCLCGIIAPHLGALLGMVAYRMLAKLANAERYFSELELDGTNRSISDDSDTN